MRRQMAAITLGLTAAAGAFAAQASSAPRHRAQRLPHLVAGSYSGIRPRGIFFSGDSGNIVLQLRWARWTQTTAVGHGTSDIQGCVPNCAAGSETPAPTRVTLSRPRAGHFTEVVEVRAGHTYVGRFGDSSWPEGAQR